MPSNFQAFTEKFAPHLLGTKRWDAFTWIASTLFALQRPVSIGETGAMRRENNWAGDGHSSVVWDFIARTSGGQMFTVDIDPEACGLVRRYCAEDTHRIICSDSIRFLSSDTYAPLELDFLYLDSMDFFFGNPRSSLHHAGELAACYDRLKSGCLIAVDDCHTSVEGKHIMIRSFFDQLGVKPDIEGYVTVWRKP